MTGKRRHRNPWPVAPAPAWTVAAGAILVVDGFDYVVATVWRHGLPLAPDGRGFCVQCELRHPGGRRGRPRNFEPPTITCFAADPVQLRAGSAPVDWRGF